MATAPIAARGLGRTVRAVAFLLAALLGSAGAHAQRAYHFSPDGDDAHGDGSAENPWATVARANALDLAPGDALLFEGGASFDAGLYLDPDDAGTPGQPVVVSAYGSGRATLDAGDGFGLYVYNAGGIEVSRLVVVGSGAGTNTDGGIIFYADLPGDVQLAHLRVDDVDVSGFGKSGLSVGAWNGRSGWRDVRVTRSAFHRNRDGMDTYAEVKGGLADVYVGHCRFYRNEGARGLDTPSGSGLVLGGVDGALVERSVAYRNGARNTHTSGPVGIWAYESNAVVIQHNEAWGNRAGSGNDGGGFDLDGGVTNSVVQYNYSHGNEGAGFGLFQYAGASAYGGNVVRYNVSEDDGRKNGYGGISVWGASGSDLVEDTEVYHNTVFVGRRRLAPGERPSAIELKNRHHRGVAFRNNLLVTAAGLPLVEAPASAEVRFEGNAYWSGSAPFAVVWGGATYTALASWREASGQERFGGEDTGHSLDPRLAAPGRGGIIGNPDSLWALAAYRLESGSPLTAAALDLSGSFGIHPGTADFYGTPLGPLGGVAVGAHEPAENVTVLGPIESLSSVGTGAGTLTVEGAAFRITAGTTIAGEDGIPVAFEDLAVGALVAVKGAEVENGVLAARIAVRGSATPFEAPRGPRDVLALAAVYPNPAAAHATLAVNLPSDADVTVLAYDPLGRRVLNTPVGQVPAGPARLFPLDLSPLAAGTYVVRVIAVSRGVVEAVTGRITVAR